MRAFDAKFGLSVSISAMALAFGMVAATPASAAVCAWGAGNSNWDNPANWSCGSIPGSGDTVNILAGGSIVGLTGINASAGTIALGSGNIVNMTNSNLYIYGQAIANNGIFNIKDGSSLISGNGVVALTGTGVFALDDANGVARLYSGGFSIASGITIRGAGQLGIGQSIFSNAGLVSANLNGRVLSIDTSGGNGGVGNGNGFGTNGNAAFYNTGTLEATNGGFLNLEGGLYENGASGVIRALNGSAVNINADARILGGTLTTAGTGVINAHGTSQYLNNVTVSAGSHVDVDNDNLYLNTSFVNNGTVTVGHNGSLINEGGILTITGSGSIDLDDSNGVARIYGGQIVFGSNQSLTGSGQLGIGQVVVTNNNLFSVGNGGALSIDVSGGNGGVGNGNGVGTNLNSGLLNNGVIEAKSGSTVSFEGGLYENAPGGIFRALGGSTLNLNADSRILGGTLTTDATSIINAHGTSQYLSNVTLSSGSHIDVDNDNLYLNSSFTNNGTITVGHNGSILNESGLLTINGTGTIKLDDSNGVARIYGGIITFGAGQTLTGSGQLGVGQTDIVINNVFSANAGTLLSIDVSGGNGGVGNGNGVGTNGNSGLMNNSIIEATGGSAVSFEGGLYENSANAVIRALAGSTVNLNADSRFLGGTLTTVGTGIINAHNTSQYLNNVTLSAGSHIDVDNDNLYLNTSFVNNGLVTVGHNGNLLNEGGVLTITGSGTIQLDNSAGVARIYGGQIVFGSNQSVTGSGELGIGQVIVTNNNLFSVGNGGALSIDVSGGNGGVGNGNGVGTNLNSGLLNNGVIEAKNASTIWLQGGLYENASGGIFRALGGSTFNLNADSRVLGGTLTSDATSVINAHGTSQYLQNVTLSNGSKLDVNNDNLYLNTSFVNNGTVTVGNNGNLFSEGGGLLTISGNGTIVLDDSVSVARIYSGNFTIGSGQTVRGSGQLGIGQAIYTINGTVSADVAGRGISIDVSGGSGGVGNGNGVGPGTQDAGLFNTGLIRAINGSTLALEGGKYVNDAVGTIGAYGAGSTVLMNSDSNLTNLLAGDVLSLGHYVSSTSGAASTLNLRGTGANSIATIGTGNAGTDTVVTLSGINSVLNVTGFGSSVNTAIDSSLTGIAQSGRLELLDGRSMTITAAGGAFSNAGILQLGGGTFGASSFANSGLTFGNGAISLAIANTGTVEASGGTLATRAITGATGTIRSLAGATLDMSAAAGNSTAGFLTNNGALNIGTRTVTVTSDYQNAGFGQGNAFDAHANVAGSGLIFATSATMDVTGANLVGNSINVGNVRTGGSSATTITITNHGTATTLRGAVQNSNAPTVQVSGADWVIGPNGGSADVTLSFTGNSAGSFSEQLGIVNNFDNVADKTIVVTGNVYQVAQAGSIPASITLAARRVGDAAASSNFGISNAAPQTNGFTEQLQAAAVVGGPFRINGLTSVNTVVDAGNTTAVALSLGTGTAGTFSNMVSIANTSLAVPGSGLQDLPLAGQSINVSGNVYALAAGTVSGNTVDFGVVRQNAADVNRSVSVSNTASGALTDQLVTTVGALPTGVTGSAPGALNGGQSGNASFTMDTANAGIVSGSTSLGFTSHNSEMADVSVGSQTVNFTGTVTEIASAAMFKDSGTGALMGSGNALTFDFGTLSADTGMFVADLGVTNGNSGMSFSELLGGSFSFSGNAAFGFSGAAFANLAGGDDDLGNLLDIDTTGLSDGVYNATLTFSGYSHFAGLNDLALSPITVSIKATITGSGNPNPPTPGVPEPATWGMMLAGFGMLGAMMRRRRVALSFS